MPPASRIRYPASHSVAPTGKTPGVGIFAKKEEKKFECATGEAGVLPMPELRRAKGEAGVYGLVAAG